MLTCDHCGWSGESAMSHPRLDQVVCPACWSDGFETIPREKRGGLMEALAAGEPSSRRKKLLIDWTDEEMEIWERIERFRLLHESSPVVLPTTVETHHQTGFDFMREEFKVQGNRRQAR